MADGQAETEIKRFFKKQALTLYCQSLVDDIDNIVSAFCSASNGEFSPPPFVLRFIAA